MSHSIGYTWHWCTLYIPIGWKNCWATIKGYSFAGVPLIGSAFLFWGGVKMLRSEYGNKWIMRCRAIAWLLNSLTIIFGCLVMVGCLVFGIIDLVNGEEKTSYFSGVFWCAYLIVTPLLVFNALTVSPSEIKSDTIFCVSESLIIVFLLLHSLFAELSSASYAAGIVLLCVLAVGVFFSCYFTCPATRIRLFIAHFFSDTHLTREDWLTETEHYNERKSLLACICGGGLIVFMLLMFMVVLFALIVGVSNLYGEAVYVFVLYALLLVQSCAELIVLCRIYVLVGKEKERIASGMLKPELVMPWPAEREESGEHGAPEGDSALKRIGKKIKALVKDYQTENAKWEKQEPKGTGKQANRLDLLLQKTGKKFFVKYYTQIRDWAETDALDAVEESYPAEMVLGRIRAGKRIFAEKLEIMALFAIIGAVNGTDEETRQKARGLIEQALNNTSNNEKEDNVKHDLISK